MKNPEGTPELPSLPEPEEHTDSPEQAPAPEYVAEQLADLFKRIEERRSRSREQGQEHFTNLRQDAVAELGEAAVVDAEQATNVRERLTQNEHAQDRLVGKTVESVRAVVDLLSSDLPFEERKKLLASLAERVGFGTFYDTHRVGEAAQSEVVVKDLKLNYLYGAKDAARMLARHALENKRCKEYFGDMVPESAFIVFPAHQAEFEQEQERIKKGDKKLYDFPTFLKNSFDRRLQEDYAKRDVTGERRGPLDYIAGKAGKLLKKIGLFREESVGVMVQEHVRGISFAKFFETFSSENCPNYETLRQNVGAFIERARAFNERYALLWHRFDSDNIVVEVDEKGLPTGQVKLLDVNFTEKSFERVRRNLVKKMDKRMLQPLAERFGLTDQT